MESEYWDQLIDESNFYHVIQPIMDLSINRVQGYEVLLRSNGFENPELLFKYAKENNRLFELDMKAILKAIRTFKDGTINMKESKLYINIFPSTLTNPEFQYNIQKIKSNTTINEGSIVFEINEAEKVADLTTIQEGIEELKQQGFLIALDDIGKGESTLQSILELKPNIAKIDRYFAEDLSNSHRKQRLITLMLDLFEGDTTMVLEGFEREEDLLKAQELGVPFGQGYFLGRPQPIGYYI